MGIVVVVVMVVTRKGSIEAFAEVVMVTKQKNAEVVAVVVAMVMEVMAERSIETAVE